MARMLIAAVSAAALLAAPAFASASSLSLSSVQGVSAPTGVQGAELGTHSGKHSKLTSAGTGYALAALVAVGIGVGIATSKGKHHGSSASN